MEDRCVDSEKDLGVTFNCSFGFEDHVRNNIAKAKDLGVTFNRSFGFEDHVRNSIAKANGTIAWVTFLLNLVTILHYQCNNNWPLVAGITYFYF